MKRTTYLQRLKTNLRGRGWPQIPPHEEPPLRSELFSADQMEQHGKALAGLHRLAPGNAPDQLLGRLAENESTLLEVCRLLGSAATENRRITPAGDWLVDNFYLIEEQIRTARRHLPEGYSRELPRLDTVSSGGPAGRPRVYEIALETVAHGDGRVDAESLSRFVAAYQTVSVLKLGELWAVPIMLRLAVIENLRRVAVRVGADWAERDLAGSWADQMTQVAVNDPKGLILVIADMARSNPPMVSAFVAELARRLQGRGPALALPLTWIEQRLAEAGLTIDQLVRSENQQQAADQVSVSNSIASLRVLGAIDWREFVEHTSIVEQTLRQDPAGVYGGMDFATRDRYRHATEALARKGRLSEEEVARAAVELARAAAASGDANGGADRAGHVGYFLTDRGLPALEQVAQVRLSSAEALSRAAGRMPLVAYLGAIMAITVVLGGALLVEALDAGISIWATLALSVIAMVSVSQLAVALVNWLATLLVAPHPLPKMDFSKGIPARSRTLVVIPTMLTSAQSVEDLTEALEVRFLANRDPSLHFGLLTDFLDAQQETLPEDAPLAALAAMRIDELNEKYGRGEGWIRDEIFFLFHRPRRWNPQERVWMGHERKRGKLADLNALLRGRAGAAGERFALIVGDTEILTSVKYVITLDTDTQLPPDTARQLVGALAHPLNRARYDKSKGRVCEGYAILQPRVSVSLPGTNRSRYARLYGGEPGIDPYTRAVSDVYQDVFGEGSFVGKGIYDVDAFEQALEGCFPENRILSHDLLEGCYARAGLLSDVEVYEGYPAQYSADVSRRYRWIRGDWQLTGWLRRRVTGEGKRRLPNPLSMLSQWKLADNLRRSLVPTALMLLLLTGWTVLTPAWLMTLAVVGILLIPSLCAAVLDLLRKPDEVLLRQHLGTVADSATRRLMQVGFELACLPYEAYFSLDAVVRTLWRMHVARRRLLEWDPSSEVDRSLSARDRSDAAAWWRSMWIGPVVTVLVAAYLVVVDPMVLLVAGPVLLLWLASPGIAWWISLPLERTKASLTAAQTFFLRALARRTWAFFDTFVGADDHWLPPDNYQEYRVASVAHRTSPTNIGMALLANLSAYDFGYIPAGRLIQRTTDTLQTMEGLARHRGHFYNWYDTQTLQPMAPLYVSTVDSGNLAGHLLTLRAGLLALADDKVLAGRVFEGLGDTLAILVDVADASDNAEADALVAFTIELEAASAAPPVTLAGARATLVRLAAGATELVARFGGDLDLPASAAAEREAKAVEAQTWAEALARQCQEALHELDVVAPWLAQAGAAGRSGYDFDTSGGPGGIPSLRELALHETQAATSRSGPSPAPGDGAGEAHRSLNGGSTPAGDRIAVIERLAQQCGEFAQMDYEFLFDKTRHLLTIGYNVEEHRVDAGYYDLLASEARLCTFVAIAQGQVPQESWFALGRLLTGTGGAPVLLSWSGSMFEYLMPLLVMPTYDQTLLDQTCKAAVARQIEYGLRRGVPWGISESGYNTVDMHLNYQYRAFGVPGLGLKRGLADDLVIAPYASVLALMVAPEAACVNLQRLAGEGFLGKYGFFEAIDYSPVRQRRGQSHAVVRSFMAHHQGMSLLALAYQVLDRPMQRRFESDPLFQAVMLLLQERIPKATALFAHTAKLSEVAAGPVTAQPQFRVFTSPDTPVPEVQLLSNGRYHVMVTNAGGGYSRWKDLAVTRWREDATCDNRGTFCYVRELTAGTDGGVWSTSHQPTLTRALGYEAIFSEGRAEFRRSDPAGARDGAADGDFETYTELVVSPEDDIELRRVRITNRSRQRRQIDVTTYAEVVLAPSAADALHPAFSNLFVQTEILPERRAILCTRRPRSVGEQAPWMLHLLAVRGAQVADISYETDRLRFVGRARTSARPQAMSEPGPLSGTDGSVLDPIVAIRCALALGPGESATIDVVSGIGETREAAVSLVEKYQDRHLADRVFDLAAIHSQVVLRQLNATEADAQLHARLAGSVIHANAALRAEPDVLLQNRRGQSGLWGYAISGDLPIVLLQIGDAANIDLVRQLVQAHAHWRLKGLAVDLVIWNEEHVGYRQRLQDQIMGLISSGSEASVMDRPGGVFVRAAEQMSAEDRILLQSVARVILTDGRGTLLEQLDHHRLAEARPPLFVASHAGDADDSPEDAVPMGDVILFNGLGGFTPDGREYVISLGPDDVTPAPWVNVLANPHFGTVISESGGAYTWNENAHAFRLTPWHNDPISDSCGEAMYLRDEETGRFWSPTPLPTRAATSYVVRHGFGYSVFETRSGGVWTELRVFVAIDAAVKFSVLKVRNESGRARRLSVTGYVEWVLGDLGSKSAMHVSTEIAPRSGALYARNPYSSEFGERTAFFDVDDPTRTLSGDRTEVIGRNGTLREPAMMHRTRLSGRVGAALDPCGAIQVNVDLADGQEHEVVFRLGVGHNADEAAALVHRFRGLAAAHNALEAVEQHWKHTLGAVQVDTPDPAVNVLANGWLVYQTLACRTWARSGYYQSSGAFGFRDQLQDGMALLHTKPELVRAHLLLCASRQFQEGDVQHWWHPPSGRGVRTRCSDDYLWLPLAVSRYVTLTGDTSVLDERVFFLEGRPVDPEDDSYYDLPGRSADVESVYQHCVRAIRNGLRFGEHGLPLIGAGDWNDGMNLVGIKGRGESVWLGFFLCEVLRQFAALARANADPSFADFCAQEGERLRHNIEQHGWDGEWYRRAWFDDGTPLGSSGSTECRIDSISQSWSVLSGAGDATRSRLALKAVNERLVRRDHDLVQLLDPPFDKSSLNPGYIRGYVPGVRENGGQYTHGAIWAAMAFSALGERDRAWELFDMINPVNHALSPQSVAVYKVEPYVVAADVYAAPPHIGRGGWTWYTGSAGWMYRLVVESLLGIRREGETLQLFPCMPTHWPGYKLDYRYRDTVYHIAVSQTNVGDPRSGVTRVRLDGVERTDSTIHLVDDQREHHVEVEVANG